MNTDVLTILKRKIRDNVLKTEPKDASKNPLWQNFVAIFEEVDDDKKVIIPFVDCIKCSSVMSYNSSIGTGRAGSVMLMSRPEQARLYK